MNVQEELQPIISIKGVETTPQKYMQFRDSLRTALQQSFVDSTYMFRLLTTELENSMSTRDKGLIDYEMLKREELFSLRCQSSIGSKYKR